MVAIPVREMRDIAPHDYPSFILRGVIAILLGLGIFFFPGMALLTFVFMFGAYAVADGIFNLVSAFRKTGTERHPRWVLALAGVVSVIAGVLAFVMPGITALSLLFIIAAWAIARGIVEIVGAIRLRKTIHHEWLLGLTGALSIVFGLLMIMAPGAGAMGLLYWIGAYSVASGIMLIALGLKLRKIEKIEGGHGDTGGFTTPAHSH